MTVAVNVLRKSLHLMHAQRHWDLQHDVGGIVPALGRIKITGQAGRLAVRTNVDFYRRTIDTAETSANNVLLAIEALDTGVLERLVCIVKRSSAIRSFRATD
jgi:hypothetical protein